MTEVYHANDSFRTGLPRFQTVNMYKTKNRTAKLSSSGKSNSAVGARSDSEQNGFSSLNGTARFSNAMARAGYRGTGSYNTLSYLAGLYGSSAFGSLSGANGDPAYSSLAGLNGYPALGSLAGLNGLSALTSLAGLSSLSSLSSLAALNGLPALSSLSSAIPVLRSLGYTKQAEQYQEYIDFLLNDEKNLTASNTAGCNAANGRNNLELCACAVRERFLTNLACKSPNEDVSEQL
ncbi:hypothetical protein EBB54_26810 [Schaedlerella arabinosiphila]|uniref:Uncharacterized protein n=2 Tax=Schaedlerella arabinosiphila TaxID=2044587 RepID=A0A3R8LJA6_9FIRM|nr:hypothetical protein EBB54_26810 [Schaedlerella arabinosiphila]